MLRPFSYGYRESSAQPPLVAHAATNAQYNELAFCTSPSA